MYTKAHEILGILYSHADEGRYKKTEEDGKQVENKGSTKDDTDAGMVNKDEGKTKVTDGTTE